MDHKNVRQMHSFFVWVFFLISLMVPPSVTIFSIDIRSLLILCPWLFLDAVCYAFRIKCFLGSWNGFLILFPKVVVLI